MAFPMKFSVIVFSTILVSFPFCTTLALRSSFSPLYPTPENKGTTLKAFTARLIHRSSPESPIYDQHATTLDFMKDSMRTSLARSVYIGRLRSKNFSSSMKYPSSRVDIIDKDTISNDYVMRYSIGTPPVETFAVPDTGSSLTWLQCLSCTNCYNQSIPIYDPSKSSSYKPILCESKECNNTAYTNCDGSQPECTYSVTYMDGSYSIGNIAIETLLFQDGNQGHGHYPLFNMLFGCGHINLDTTGEYVPGVVGLSNHSSSLIGQQGSIEFSYCISSNVNSGHSQIRFGSGVILSGRLTTALSPNVEGLYFFKNVDGIFVEGEKVDAPEWVFQYVEGALGGLMMDTGTTYSNLYTTVLDALILEIYDKMPSNMEAERDISNSGWDLCYDNKYRFTEVLPEIELRFKGNEEPFPLSNQNAWIDNGHGQFCLAIGRSNDTSILGMYQQRDVNVGMDLKQAMVSFKYDFDCAEFCLM